MNLTKTNTEVQAIKKYISNNIETVLKIANISKEYADKHNLYDVNNFLAYEEKTNFFYRGVIKNALSCKEYQTEYIINKPIKDDKLGVVHKTTACVVFSNIRFEKEFITKTNRYKYLLSTYVALQAAIAMGLDK